MNPLVANRDRLTTNFMRLARIDSASLQEGAIAATVTAELESLGWEVTNDQSGPDTGNLIARLHTAAPPAERWLFASHLDVVPPCRSVSPGIRDGWIESDGTTVLGADAKASVAAVLEAVRVLHERSLTERAGALELLFTWGEEVGHRGAKALDPAALQARSGFVLDALLPVGTIVVSAPGYDAFTVCVRGRAAHAGVEPENGVSAITVAARAIDRLPWGRLDELTTANVGLISGGTARNAVPETVELVGEIRSLDATRLAARGQAIRATFQDAAAAFRAEVDIDLQQVYAGYQLPAGARCVVRARLGLAPLGLTASLAATGGGSDANELNAIGLQCCVLGIGAQACHSVRERISLDQLGRLADWVLAIASVNA